MSDMLGTAQLSVETSVVLTNGSVVTLGVDRDKIKEPGHGVAAWRHSSSLRYDK